MKNEVALFDFSSVQKAAAAFALATGVHTTALPTRKEDGQGLPMCTLCRKMKELSAPSHNCRNIMLYGSYQAQRFDGQYIFYCPLGLVHFASPVIADGQMCASLIGGPVMMFDHEEFLQEDIFEKFRLPEKHFDECLALVKDFPVLTPERLNALSNLLYMAAASLCDKQYLEELNQRSLYDKQAEISEYIHSLKQQGTQNLPLYPIDKERTLISLISEGDKAGAQKVLNEILGYIFFSTGRDFEIIKARVTELVVLLSRAALDGGADVGEIFGLNSNYLQEIQRFENEEQLSLWLSKIMVRFTECVFDFIDVKHADVIYKAMEYIRRNYMKKLSLEGVAKEVYLSPSYFSKVFKDETGLNFNAYLNKIRIENSKKILLNDEINLVDVSSLVGFEDQSYFSKVFKKLTGVTPGRFRDARGKIK